MTDTAPRYKVLRAIPHYNDRDGIDGYSFQLLGRAHTLAWAHALARKFDDGEGSDETYVEVHDRVFRARAYTPPALAYASFDEVPF